MFNPQNIDLNREMGNQYSIPRAPEICGQLLQRWNPCSADKEQTPRLRLTQSILTTSLERACCYDPQVPKEKIKTSAELLPVETTQLLMARHSEHSESVNQTS